MVKRSPLTGVVGAVFDFGRWSDPNLKAVRQQITLSDKLWAYPRRLRYL